MDIPLEFHIAVTMLPSGFCSHADTSKQATKNLVKEYICRNMFPLRSYDWHSVIFNTDDETFVSYSRTELLLHPFNKAVLAILISYCWLIIDYRFVVVSRQMSIDHDSDFFIVKKDEVRTLLNSKFPYSYKSTSISRHLSVQHELRGGASGVNLNFYMPDAFSLRL